MVDCDFELSQEFVAFATKVRGAARGWGEDGKRIEASLRILAAALRKYNNSLQTLIQGAGRAEENVKLSAAVCDLMGQERWASATAKRNGAVLKRVLLFGGLPEGFVSSLQFTLRSKPTRDAALGRLHALPPEDAARTRVEEWKTALESGTRNKSPLSIRNIVAFFRNTCAAELGLDLHNWPADVAVHVKTRMQEDPDVLKRIVGGSNSSPLKATRLRFFLNEILKTDVVVPKAAPTKRNMQCEDDDGRDEHRIASEDLQKIHDLALRDPFDHLWFMLMLTTGLRIGGVVKILTKNVADVRSGKYVVRSQGRTKEKGGKFVHFSICPSLQDLFGDWLHNHRRADSGPYLLPGVFAESSVTTNCIRERFAAICKHAGLKGKQFHPHAIRHTYAHILLECGNPLEVVSKCLNHKSTTVTEQVYLRESAVELADRIKAPWLQQETEDEKRKRTVQAMAPFLRTQTDGTSTKKAEDKERRKRRRREIDALCETFTFPPTADVLHTSQ
jgi:site-specific recombinase XerC